VALEQRLTTGESSISNGNPHPPFNYNFVPQPQSSAVAQVGPSRSRSDSAGEAPLDQHVDVAAGEPWTEVAPYQPNPLEEQFLDQPSDFEGMMQNINRDFLNGSNMSMVPLSRSTTEPFLIDQSNDIPVDGLSPFSHALLDNMLQHPEFLPTGYQHEAFPSDQFLSPGMMNDISNGFDSSAIASQVMQMNIINNPVQEGNYVQSNGNDTSPGMAESLSIGTFGGEQSTSPSLHIPTNESSPIDIDPMPGYTESRHISGGWHENTDLPQPIRDKLLAAFFKKAKTYFLGIDIPRFRARLTLSPRQRPHPCWMYAMVRR
jgi:hypothetical protein